ncbi:MAG: aminotransferase class I/II-fold pyridoxal phosphate-dependent enzyme [Vicinamibacterales bacterium]
MKLDQFALERYQSIWEHRVQWNLSESGVQPLKVSDLIDAPELLDRLLNQGLGYPQTNGTIELRERVASLYPGAAAGHVQITNGSSEAMCVLLMRLVEPGDELVFLMPNYMQAPGLARALGAAVRPWRLRETDGAGQRRWTADLEELRTLVGPRTRAVLICTPNNPTGARLDDATLNGIAAIAGAVGAWVVSDEVYRGAEREADDTPSMWGRYERAIVTSGLSKAYGLPGLRIGWAVGPPSLIDDLWAMHDYTTISPGAVNDALAQLALDPARRSALIARTRGIIRSNYPVVRHWLEGVGGLAHIAPEAGAIVFFRYPHATPSVELTTELRERRGVLIVPGDHFGTEGYLRIGFGSDPEYLTAALEIIGDFLRSLPRERSRNSAAINGVR